MAAISGNFVERMYTLEGLDSPEGQALLFCNGVDNPEPRDAKESAKIVSDAYGGCQVFGFHNPTTTDQVTSKTVDVNLAPMLKNVIEHHIESLQQAFSDREISLIIFAHSHGVALTSDALNLIPDATIRRSIKVYAFAGATIIPRNLVGFSVNYFHQTDLIATTGNAIINEGRLSSLNYLFNALEKAKTLEEAIGEASRIFGNEMDYNNFLERHNIVLMSNPHKLKPNYFKLIETKENKEEESVGEAFLSELQDFGKFCAKGAANIAMGAVSIAADTYTSHVFLGYQYIIADQIANKTIAKYDTPQVFRDSNTLTLHNVRP